MIDLAPVPGSAYGTRQSPRDNESTRAASPGAKFFLPRQEFRGGLVCMRILSAMRTSMLDGEVTEQCAKNDAQAS
jgi:hypothetical protein